MLQKFHTIQIGGIKIAVSRNLITKQLLFHGTLTPVFFIRDNVWNKKKYEQLKKMFSD